MTVFLALAFTDAALAAENTGAGFTPPPAESSSDYHAAAALLEQQVRDIARSRMMSHAKKEKRISTTVRVAVVAATAYKSPAEIQTIAAELGSAAARGAPEFADTIAETIAFIPAIARIDGAPGQIRVAVHAATKPAPPTESPVVPSTTMIAAVESKKEPVVEVKNPPVREDSKGWWHLPKFNWGSNTSLHFTIGASFRYDDNIYLTKSARVNDEIVTFGPGVEFQTGQAAIMHSSLSYREDFTHYLHTSSADANLGMGNADFGYDNGSLSAEGRASFQQLNQNDRDVAIIGRQAIIRRDVTSLDGSAESHLTAKSSVKAGTDYSDTHYKTEGFTNNRSLSWPLKVYYAATPKVDASVGVAYRDVEVQGAPHHNRDLYYNVGGRGDFTPKLSGEVSVGYKTRSFGQGSNDSILGFDGTLNYEVSPKTKCSLLMSRDFSTGAQGESLKNTSLTLSVSTDFDPQWQASSVITYQNVEYSSQRTDNYWEWGLTGTYLFSEEVSMSAGYTFRYNTSTLSGANFSDDIFSLFFNWRS